MTALDPKGRLLAWREEITAELEEVKKALPPLEAAHESAAAEAREMLEDFRELEHFLLANLPLNFLNGTKAPLEAPLRLRLEELRAEIEPAKTRQARALTDLELARRQIAELKRARAQIDRVVVPVEEIEEAA